MTSLKPTSNDSARSSSQDIYNQSSPTLERTRTPYHLRGDSLTKPIGLSTFSSPDAPNGYPTTALSRSESSESGTEADDEKGPLLKGLPAPPLRARKGLRGRSPAGLTPAASPLPTPPAFVEAREYAYFGESRKIENKVPQPGKQIKDFEVYKKRKRREIVRRCTETLLLCGIGATVWTSTRGASELSGWLNELTTFLLLPPLLYLAFPVRLALRARASGKSCVQALRLGFHVPSRFDPGPLLYPVTLPVLIALSLFQRCSTFLPVAVVCALSSIPPLITGTPGIPALGDHIHWLITVLPLDSSSLRWSYNSHQTPLPLRLGSNSLLAREDLALLYPLHQSLMTVLGYLTTSSLDISELRLLSTALIHLLIFARSPQAEILKAMLWLGGLCVFITCKKLLGWEVALARVPTWKLLRRRPKPGLIFQIDQAICLLLTRGQLQRRRRNSSESEYEPPMLQPMSRRRPPLKLEINGRASTMTLGKAMSAVEEPISKVSSLHTPIFSKASRRNTIAVVDNAASKEDSQGKKKTKPTATTSPPNAFLSFTLEQARVRKYGYAAAVYIFVIITILGPVRLYVGARALSGHEPFGWALGYLFGNIPAFRFWVVSNNLERWICLPARTSSGSGFHPPFSAEALRQELVGPANTRLLICIYCVVVLLLGIAAVLQLTSMVEVDTRRKVFHGIMVAMLLPTIFVDPCFIALALGLMLAIFLLLDLFRASQLPPLSRPLTTFLAPYVDGRDYRGPIIVSHIFLLIGCAIPLWLSLAAAPRGGEDPWIGWETPLRDLSMVSGVICVGMGDAAASLIGRRYGETKWYWAGGKSLEGSLAFAFAVVCGLSMGWVWLRLGGWATWHDQSVVALLGKCAVAGLGASLLESTLTAANDNVVVPVGLWLLVRGLNI